MSSKIGSGNGSGGKGIAPTPTPTPDDMAGMACDMLGMIPEPHLLPLNFALLKLEHDILTNKFNMLVSFLNEQGLDYERRSNRSKRNYRRNRKGRNGNPNGS